MKRRDFMGALGVVGSTFVYKIGSAKPPEKEVSEGIGIGVNTPLQGFFASEGKNFVLGSALAIDLINSNRTESFKSYFPHLSSSGVLGKKLSLQYLDSQANHRESERNANELISERNISMITGGSSSLESVANRKVAFQKDILCMDGINHSNDCSENFFDGFSMFFDNNKSAHLISKKLKDRLSADEIRVVSVYSDYSWSNNQARSMKEHLNKQFSNVVEKRIQYSKYESLEGFEKQIRDFQPDVIVINLYSSLLLDFTSKMNSLESSLGQKLTVIPLLTSTIRAQVSLKNLGPVALTQFGSTNSEERKCLKAFADLFRSRYGRAPSDSAAIGFYQVMQYANAVNKADSTNKSKVEAALLSVNTGPFKFDEKTHRLNGFAQVKITG